MRILLDARPLQGATGRRGVGAYVRELARGLVAADAGAEVVLMSDPRSGEAVDPPIHPQISWLPARQPPGPALFWSRVLGPAWARQAEADVVHATFLAPPRAPSDVPLVATVHDLIPLDHPQRFTRRQAHVFRRSLALAARADAVIAVSGVTAARLRDRFDIPASRLYVVPPPVAVDRLARDPEREPGGGIRGQPGAPYVLSLGGFDPLKGVCDLLLPAFAAVTERRPGVLLALSGGGPGRRDAERRALELGVAERVRFLGHLDASAHAATIRGAAAVAVASWEEGFGLPAAEALAAGVPVAIGPAAASREAAGSHGIRSDGETPAALADAIERALAAAGPNTAEGERRRRFAARYAPERVARQLLEIYRNVRQGPRA